MSYDCICDRNFEAHRELAAHIAAEHPDGGAHRGEVRVVISLEHEAPLVLGALMPEWVHDDGNVVRYSDSSGVHSAPADCVIVRTVPL